MSVEVLIPLSSIGEVKAESGRRSLSELEELVLMHPPEELFVHGLISAEVLLW